MIWIFLCHAKMFVARVVIRQTPKLYLELVSIHSWPEYLPNHSIVLGGVPPKKKPLIYEEAHISVFKPKISLCVLISKIIKLVAASCSSYHKAASHIGYPEKKRPQLGQPYIKKNVSSMNLRPQTQPLR